MKTHFSTFVFLAGFVVYVTIRGVFEQRAKGNKTKVSRVDGQERVLLVLVGAGCLLLPVVYLATSWLAFADYRLPLAVTGAGTLTMALALWLFWRAHKDLGRNWSVTLELHEEHRLITHGVYRTVRHPMYAAIWLFGLAQGMLLHNWLAGWSAFAAFAVMFFVRTPREERMMLEHFGEEYREYMRRTGRVLPRPR